MKIKVYDNYNTDNNTVVVATERNGARPYITLDAMEGAKRRIGLISGSYLRASGELYDMGYDGIDVVDGNTVVDEIRA